MNNRPTVVHAIVRVVFVGAIVAGCGTTTFVPTPSVTVSPARSSFPCGWSAETGWTTEAIIATVGRTRLLLSREQRSYLTRVLVTWLLEQLAAEPPGTRPSDDDLRSLQRSRWQVQLTFTRSGQLVFFLDRAGVSVDPGGSLANRSGNSILDSGDRVVFNPETGKETFAAPRPLGTLHPRAMRARCRRADGTVLAPRFTYDEAGAAGDAALRRLASALRARKSR